MSGKTFLATDFLGRNINVGDTIVYPGRKGSALWLASGKAVETSDFGNHLHIDTPNGKRVKLSHLDRVAVVTSPVKGA